MLLQASSAKMNNRGGLPVKNIVTAIFILLSVYLLYIYNVAQNRLHDAEMTGSRYRREVEEKANEIQGLIAAKDDFQERCENEKRELNNRLKSINQKHSLLQSQNTEIEADFMKLKQDMENLRMQHAQTESQHAQEYQTLKQTKDKEIEDLTDEVSNARKQNEELQNTIATLQAQVQNQETAKKNLLDQNAQLQLLQFQQQKQLELQKQNDENAIKAKFLQEQQQNIKVVSEKRDGDAAQILNNNNNNNFGQDNQQQFGNGIFKAGSDMGQQNVNLMSQDNNKEIDTNLQLKPANGNNEAVGGGDQQAKTMDELNAMNQARPPNMDEAPTLDEDEEDKDDDEKADEARPDVNPNDLQQGQILEPLKQDGGEVDAEGKMNVREVEERREREEADRHDPLDLGQMEQPLGLGVGGHNGDNNDNDGNNKLGQQQAPVFVEQKAGDDQMAAGLNDDDTRDNFFHIKDEVAAAMDDDDANAIFDEDEEEEDDEEEEEEAVDVNNNDRDKAVDDQLNAWQNFNMAPHPVFGANNNNNDNNGVVGVGKYGQDKELEEEEEAVDDAGDADDDYDGGAAGPV